MSLLGVFSLSKEDLSDAEVAALAQASTIAVSAITGLLLQTLMLPSPGQSNLSEAIHHPRLKSHNQAYLHTFQISIVN